MIFNFCVVLSLKGYIFFFRCLVFILFYIVKRKKVYRIGLIIFNYCFGLFEIRFFLYIVQDGLEFFLFQFFGSYDLQVYFIGMVYSQNFNINNYYFNIIALEFIYYCIFKYVNCMISFIFYYFFKEIINNFLNNLFIQIFSVVLVENI